MLFSLLGATRISAQQTPDALRPLLEKIRLAYQQASYLDFKVKYSYANESHPDQPNDSIFGEIRLDKGRCLYVINGTETLVTVQHTIQVMDEEKAIYLSKPAHPGMADPVSIMDSLLTHMKGVRFSIRQDGNTDLLSLFFPPGTLYTHLDMSIDHRNGYLQKITYFLHTEGLVGKELIQGTDHQGPYEPEGRVQLLFSQYQQGQFGDAVFNENNVITKVGNQYQPADRYKGYRVLLATPNL